MTEAKLQSTSCRVSEDTGARPEPVSEEFLASYAVRSAVSRGRRAAMPAHYFRQPFPRDRDRIIHSRAFRRLDGKTQVFLNGTGDHFRTRLTHTIEVTAIARTIARQLRLNEDLTEAIALAHDLGHTPFGHMGERVLDECLAEYGGFDHNAQSLRIVDHLEKKYPGLDGLNLSWEVRAGLIKHREQQRPCLLDGVILPPQPTLEAQVADIADDLAYYTHDVDDGCDGGLINDKALRDVTLWQMARKQAAADGAREDDQRFVPYTVRCLLDMLVGNVIANVTAELAKLSPSTSFDAQNYARRIITFTPEFQIHSQELRLFLFEHVYRHPSVMEVNGRVAQVMSNLFNHFLHDPDLMGPGTRERLSATGLHRGVADYVSGMTDGFALKLHGQYCHDACGRSEVV